MLSFPLPLFQSTSAQSGSNAFGHLFGVLCAALLVVPHTGSAQSTVTQEVQLEKGWNVISLNIQPSDSSFGTLLDGTPVSMVKNEDGAAYLPSQGVEQISVWKEDEAYRVHAGSATTLEVTGTTRSPDETPIVLEEGGNLVPYIPGTAQAVEEAFVSIEESLITVEDEDGNRYDPGASTSPLDSLRPGQGYEVYVDRADTLRYPSVTQTLDEALALTGMETGSYVKVRGYDEPGDGGGGLFQVTNSGAETDGGTVFVFDEDQSAEKSVTPGTTKPNFPETDLIWGTVTAKVGPEDGEKVEDIDMHISGGETTDRWISHKNGWIGQKDATGIYQLRNDIGGGTDYAPTYNYKYATSDRRLERMNIGDSVDIRWWGAPEADPNNPKDATPYINWAGIKANRIFQNSNYDRVYIDLTGEYYYEHEITLRNGTELRGTGPSRSVPLESWATGAKLTVMPGRAIYWEANSFDADAENDVYRPLQAHKQRISNDYMAEVFGIRNLEIDGNYPTNNPWDDPDFDFSEDKSSNVLQNGSIWSGFGTTGSGSRDLANGATLHLNNVYVHHTGSNGIGGAGGLHTAGKNVHLRNSVRNHQGYALGGDTLENLTISGYGWEVAFKFGIKTDDFSTYKNVTFTDWQSNPEGLANATRISGHLSSEMEIDGFEFDLSQQGSAGDFIRDGATGMTYKNGVLRTTNNSRIAPNIFPAYRGADVPKQTLWKNIEVFNEGSGAIQIINKTNRMINMVAEDWTVKAAAGADATATEGFIGVAQAPTYKDKLDVPPRNVIRNLDYQHQVEPAINISGNPSNFSGNPFPREFFVENSDFNNVGDDLYDGYGRLALGDADANQRAQRIYLDNVTLNMPDASGNDNAHYHGLMGGDDPQEIIRIRGCQDQSGRVSEVENQTYSSTQSEEGQNFVEIPTSLISYAHGREATVTSGGSNVSSVTGTSVVGQSDPFRDEFKAGDHRDPTIRVNLDGTIQNGETIDIEYSAYVTPPDDYQTTGLFVSRPVFNKSYASGNGPFTIDLRGVAVSQESRDKVVYTASSGDTSVVTASVQSDDYTLELTEQGTGTATITVNAEISGVGTATTTFEVTIE